MPLATGTRLGSYVIDAPIGAGGMSACGPREQASLRAAQRERLGVGRLHVALRSRHADTVTDTLAAVVRGEPDWRALPADLPSGIRRLLVRCLDKDPTQRLRDIGDARLELASVGAPEATAPPRSLGPCRRRSGHEHGWRNCCPGESPLPQL